MRVIDPGHVYETDDDQTIEFIKRGPGGKLIHVGTTNEEILEILIDRTNYLNDKFPCQENIDAITHMSLALKRFNDRTAARTAQGVETQLVNHVSS